ncbi:hypothetical protein CNECB9_70012 [Cupriavidus necator]|uniref:Uncharacterized protein n=1 Tax=Cupriavidus necator TaxID=106590 RepID=A0A1K0IRG4_CUPNE|nr:hypothetical protein CNECB9_70012 [Cupriavidus necator]
MPHWQASLGTRRVLSNLPYAVVVMKPVPANITYAIGLGTYRLLAALRIEVTRMSVVLQFTQRFLFK